MRPNGLPGYTPYGNDPHGHDQVISDFASGRFPAVTAAVAAYSTHQLTSLSGPLARWCDHIQAHCQPGLRTEDGAPDGTRLCPVFSIEHITARAAELGFRFPPGIAEQAARDSRDGARTIQAALAAWHTQDLDTWRPLIETIAHERGGAGQQRFNAFTSGLIGVAAHCVHGTPLPH